MSADQNLVPPHGGTLVNRILDSDHARRVAADTHGLLSITRSPREQCDLEMLAIGAFSPLTGFIGQADFERVCRDMRLVDGTVWPIPVTLSLSAQLAERIAEGDSVALRDGQSRLLAV